MRLASSTLLLVGDLAESCKKEPSDCCPYPHLELSLFALLRARRGHRACVQLSGRRIIVRMRKAAVCASLIGSPKVGTLGFVFACVHQGIVASFCADPTVN